MERPWLKAKNGVQPCENKTAKENFRTRNGCLIEALELDTKRAGILKIKPKRMQTRKKEGEMGSYFLFPLLCFRLRVV